MNKKTCFPIPKPMYSSLWNEGIFLSILFIEQVVLLENMCFVSGFMHQALLNTVEFTLYLVVYWAQWLRCSVMPIMPYHRWFSTPLFFPFYGQLIASLCAGQSELWQVNKWKVSNICTCLRFRRTGVSPNKSIVIFVDFYYLHLPRGYIITIGSRKSCIHIPDQHQAVWQLYDHLVPDELHKTQLPKQN